MRALVKGSPNFTVYFESKINVRNVFMAIESRDYQRTCCTCACWETGIQKKKKKVGLNVDDRGRAGPV